MDGRRWKTWAVASLLTAGVGCSGTGKKDLTSGVTPPPAAGGGNAVSRMFATKPPGATAPKFQPADAVVDSGKKKGPIKPDTIAALANAQVGAAFDFQQDGQVNPNLDRMTDEARMKFQKALEADPKNKDALLGLARLYTRLGDRERAVGTLQTLLKHHPDDHKTAYELALTHARFEDWTGGMAACQRALSGDPENRRYQKTLGILTARSGDLEKGFDTLARVTSEAEARFTMAKLLQDMDRPELAHQQLQLAVKADPTYTPAQEWLASFSGQPQTPPQNPVQAVEYREPVGN
ncbi:tetratricopeptide repeat protein [Limnoglobus roseus]|uniref:Tetratricopeptide repeat protein n=1 Tax=Limnoglobus roseus TaxID=2598579 RepID=A0A5C1A4B5_9BACT|nr:tetratricopeptide repeat protein [Limnoglobus roseus]QEL13217.1 tetratricopeptide repeat protein [Limnoglobus roseus]